MATARRVRAAERGEFSAAVTTARALGLDARPEPAWRQRDYGDWSGQCLTDLPSAEIAGWIAAPQSAPPGGESVDEVVQRVDRRLRRGFADGLHVVVTSADVVRVAALVVLGAPGTSYGAIDVAPLDALEVTLNGDRRALRSLRPYPDWL
ncbi:histidine phosphatase family protein [Cumulibacter manganitolerans]|uniref:histidine phosphatase family protein n=1 Tax=Cumulibacter manganitolerans TaxID=1884992 RepID=UPI001E2B9740|nr:histidine phosphatase family protein [Cumulibacter manganitolerans]